MSINEKIKLYPIEIKLRFLQNKEPTEKRRMELVQQLRKLLQTSDLPIVSGEIILPSYNIKEPF